MCIPMRNFVRTDLDARRRHDKPVLETVRNAYPLTVVFADLCRFEIRVGIVAACIPTLRPGFKWLTEKLSSGSTTKEHYKLSDEVRLKAVGDTFSEDSIKRQDSPRFGNNVSVDVEQGHMESPEDRIRKFSTVDVDYR